MSAGGGAMPGRPRPSLWRIVSHDWLALFALLGVPIIWLISLAWPLLREGAGHVPALAATITAICIALLAWRVWRVCYLFRRGHEAEGVVTRLKIVRDRGRLEYAFSANGERIYAWFPVHRTQHVLRMREGTPVTVLYKETNPAFSIVRELFTNPAPSGPQS